MADIVDYFRIYLSKETASVSMECSWIIVFNLASATSLARAEMAKKEKYPYYNKLKVGEWWLSLPYTDFWFLDSREFPCSIPGGTEDFVEFLGITPVSTVGSWQVSNLNLHVHMAHTIPITPRNRDYLICKCLPVVKKLSCILHRGIWRQ